MIKVLPAPKPDFFDIKVKKPGCAFLRKHPKPTQQQWNSHSYWRRTLFALHQRYNGICAYSCHWIPYDTGEDTVEHFKPKSKYPNHAYEWTNYRLVCQLLNSRKGKKVVIDPFQMTTGWFVIDFPSLMVRPADGLVATIRKRVESTCIVLGLNEENTCMLMRQEFVIEYCLGNINYTHIEKRAPFLALEMKRQGYDDLDKIKTVMSCRAEQESSNL